MGLTLLLALPSVGFGVVDVGPPKMEPPLGVEAAFPKRVFVEGAAVEVPPEREPVGFVASPRDEPPPNRPPDGVVELGLLPKMPPEAVDVDEVIGLVFIPPPEPRVLVLPKILGAGLPTQDVIVDSDRGK